MSHRLIYSIAGLLLALGLFATACSTPASTLSTAPTPTPLAAPSIASIPPLSPEATATSTTSSVGSPTASSADSPTAPATSSGPTAAPTSAPTVAAPTAPAAANTTPAPATACTNVASFVTDVSLPDNSSVTPGQAMSKIWRLRNRGTCAWGAGYTFSFVGGQAMTSTTSVAVPDTAPAATADIQVPMTAPTTPGTYRGYWQMHDSSGKAFGPQVWALIKSAAPAAAPTVAPPSSGGSAATCVNAARFVTDLTVPDNTVMSAGQTFSKTWQLRNSGTCTWGAGYSLTFVSGQSMASSNTVSVPNTAPGATVDLQVSMTAPTTPGASQAIWQLRAPNGSAFGPQVWALINVSGAAAPATPTP